MQPNSSVIYTTHPDATPEAELSALAAVYKFVLAKKNAGGAGHTTGDDAKKGSLKHEVHEVRAEQSIPRG